jgi:very-short-patch-repair endonuclease
MFYYDSKLKDFSRRLRSNMTDAEQLLWSKVRRKQLNGYQFYRQRIVGEYIVDFYCPKANLIIELDGGQHYVEDMQLRDAERDHYLRAQGYQILRVSNRELFENLIGVLEKIYEYL